MSRPALAKQRREWANRVRLQNESGQNLSQWCREHQIKYKSMLYWRKKFKPTPERAVERSSFKELSNLPESTQITLEYQRVQIHLSKNFEPSIVMAYLKVLKGE